LFRLGDIYRERETNVENKVHISPRFSCLDEVVGVSSPLLNFTDCQSQRMHWFVPSFAHVSSLRITYQKDDLKAHPLSCCNNSHLFLPWCFADRAAQYNLSN